MTEQSAELYTERERAQANELGRAVAVMLATQQHWIHRRVETIEFLDVSRIRRRMSMDFVVPSTDLLFADEMATIPLAVLAKRNLENFDIRDEQGCPLPILGKDENGPVAIEALVGLLDWELPEGTDVSDHVRELIRGVVCGSPTEVEAGCAALLHDETDDPQILAFRGSRDCLRFTEWFAEGFVLLVRIRAKQGERRILKYSYETDRAYRFPRLRMLVSEFAFLVKLPEVSLAKSYHVEVVPPPEMMTASAELSTYTASSGGVLEVSGASASRVHLRPSAPVEYGADGWLDLQLWLRPAGVLAASALASTVCTLTLAAGLMLRWLADLHPSGSDSAALIVAVPAVVAAYFGSAEEHPVVARASSGPRALLALASLATFVAAASLVVRVDHGSPLRWWAWGIAAGISLLTSVILTTAWYRSRRIWREAG